MNVTRAVLPVMREQRSGHVITISSSAGFAGFEYGTAYAASKFGVDGWMESLAPEIEPFGIHTTVVNPGFFRTELLTAESTDYAPASIEDYAERNAAQREFWEGMNGKQGGDPAKLAQALLTSPRSHGRRFGSSPAPTRSRRPRTSSPNVSSRSTPTATCRPHSRTDAPPSAEPSRPRRNIPSCGPRGHDARLGVPAQPTPLELVARRARGRPRGGDGDRPAVDRHVPARVPGARARLRRKRLGGAADVDGVRHGPGSRPVADRAAQRPLRPAAAVARRADHVRGGLGALLAGPQHRGADGVAVRAGPRGRGCHGDRERRRARPVLRRGRVASVLVAHHGHGLGADPRPAGRRPGAQRDVVARDLPRLGGAGGAHRHARRPRTG